MQVIDDPGTDNLLLVMEYIDGGTLEQPAKSEGIWECIPEKLVQKHVRDICRVRPLFAWVVALLVVPLTG